MKIRTASFFSGSSIGVLSSTCASCSSLGLFLASTLGAAGVTASSFLSNYQIPVAAIIDRTFSLGLLFGEQSLNEKLFDNSQASELSI